MSAPLRSLPDRSTQGRCLVAAVRGLVGDGETIDDRYGVRPAQHVPDLRWITDATADGRVLVGADRYMLRDPPERRAVCRARARDVVFGAANLRIARMIELLSEHLSEIRGLPLNCSDIQPPP